MLVLLVEDDPFLQIDIAATVEDLGHRVLGPYSAVREALAGCAASPPDAAIIDFNLGQNDDSSELAEYLLAEGIPFVFSTGYSARHIPERFADVAVIEKPYLDLDIKKALAGFARPDVSG